MFKNYLKVAFRSISKNKTFSLIKVLSLTIGLSASFVIGLIVYYDFSFDTFHKNGSDIYRITSEFKSPKATFYNRGVAQPLGPYLEGHKIGFEVVSSFSTQYFSRVAIAEEDRFFRDRQQAILATPSYFKIFNYEWLLGSPLTLNEPNTVILSESTARTYFPKVPIEDVIGKSLVYDGIPAKVTGIVADLQQRTDLYFKEFISKETARNTHLKDRVFSHEWDGANSSTQLFVRVLPGYDLSKINLQLENISTEFASADSKKREETRIFHLEPLAHIHFNKTNGIFDYTNYVADKGVLLTLGLIALFLLLLACINFINLSTAQATQRGKEIGIRKTLGGLKKQLVFQFMTETALLTFTAAILAILFSFWLLQIFADFLPQGVDFVLFQNPIVILGTISLLILISLLAGFYPALVLSNFSPLKVLNSQLDHRRDKPKLRQYLTVFQFVIAQVFIIAMLVVGKQLNYMMSQEMGFKTASNIYIRAWHDDDLIKRQTLAKELNKIPEITKVSLAGNPPASKNFNMMTAVYFKEGIKINTILQQLYGDLNYRKVYDIQLLAGRDRLNDTISEFVINEAGMKSLGFESPEEVLGEIINVDNRKIPVVGVMKDFHQRSLKSTIDPMVLTGDSNRNFYAQFNTLHLSLNGNIKDLKKTLDKIDEQWALVYPNEPLEVNFMDETISQFYTQERKTSILLAWATGLSILIGCLGLLGLVVYTTERRTREIGIRKVLGASIVQLNILLCKDFMKLVGVAFIIAIPLAWYSLQKWLEKFAFKTDLSWWVFIVSGFLMCLIALFIMSIKTIAKANVNPVKSLRSE